MAITYTSNSNIPNDTVAFKNFLYQVFLANELGGNASTNGLRGLLRSWSSQYLMESEILEFHSPLNPWNSSV